MVSACGLRRAGKGSRLTQKNLHHTQCSWTLYKCNEKQKTNSQYPWKLTTPPKKENEIGKIFLKTCLFWRLPFSNFKPPFLLACRRHCEYLLQCPHLPNLCLRLPSMANGGKWCVCCAFLASHCFHLFSLTPTQPPGRGKGFSIPWAGRQAGYSDWENHTAKWQRNLVVSAGLRRAGQPCHGLILSVFHR